jgi:hypothetical protein
VGTMRAIVRGVRGDAAFSFGTAACYRSMYGGSLAGRIGSPTTLRNLKHLG